MLGSGSFPGLVSDEASFHTVQGVARPNQPQAFHENELKGRPGAAADQVVPPYNELRTSLLGPLPTRR